MYTFWCFKALSANMWEKGATYLASSSGNIYLFWFYCFIYRGVVLSTKMRNTVILRRDYLHYIKKYNRFEKRHHNLPAHLSPAFARTKIGDIVTVGQCRPISKTVRFNVVRVEKQRVEGNVRKTFVMFWAWHPVWNGSHNHIWRVRMPQKEEP